MLILTASHSSDCFTSVTISFNCIIRSSFTRISGFSKVVCFIYCSRLTSTGSPFLLDIFRNIFVVPSSRCRSFTSFNSRSFSPIMILKTFLWAVSFFITDKNNAKSQRLNSPSSNCTKSFTASCSHTFCVIGIVLSVVRQKVFLRTLCPIH